MGKTETPRTTVMRYVSIAALAAVISAVGVFLLPELYTEQTTPETQEGELILPAVLLAAGIASCVLIAAVFCRIATGERYIVSLSRAAIIFLIFLCCVLILSVLLGLAAVLIYSLLKNTMTLDQIKGIIDYAAAAAVLFLAPIFLSAFWSGISSREKPWKSLKAGSRLSRKKYLKLLIMTLVVFIAGLLILQIPDDTHAEWAAAVRMLLLTAAGTAALIISEHFCGQER
jgi:hypothetical protein